MDFYVSIENQNTHLGNTTKMTLEEMYCAETSF